MNFSQLSNLAESLAPANVILFTKNPTADVLIFKSYVNLDANRLMEEVVFTFYPGAQGITVRMSRGLAQEGWTLTPEILIWLSIMSQAISNL